MASARLLLASLALLAAAAAAGCLAGSTGGPAAGSSGAGPAGADAAPSPTSDGSGSGGNATASGNATTGWRNQTRTGGFTGARVVFGIFGKTEQFPVPEDAVNLTLVIRAPDVELSGGITPPCSSDGFGSCPSTNYETASGRYTYRATDPKPGQWSVSFFREESGAGHQRYILEIHRQVRTAP